MLDAMGGAYYASGHGKAPRGMSEAKKRAFVAPIFYAWSECDCKGVPGGAQRADYYAHGSELCAIHAKVVGNFPKDEVRRM